MKKALTLAAVAMLLTSLAAASAFADQRDPQGTWRDGQYGYNGDGDGHRDHDRVTVEGRVTRVFRDRGGVRVQLDRGRDSYWIPDDRLAGRDLRAGIPVRLGGEFRDGVVYVDDFGYAGDSGYGDGYGYREGRDAQLRGVVERVNYRLRYLILREFDGDYVKVDMRPVARYRREPDVDDLHRGDVIAISGDWRDGLFRAERVDRIRSRR